MKVLRWAAVAAVVVVCGPGYSAPQETSTEGKVVREGRSQIGVRVGESMRLSDKLGGGEYRVSDKLVTDSYSAGRSQETQEGLHVSEALETHKAYESPAVVRQQQIDAAVRMKQVKLRRSNVLF